MHLHPLTTTWQLFMRLHPVMNKLQLTYFRSLKNYHVLIFFAVSSSVPNMVEGPVSPLTHTWLIESEVLPSLSHLVMIKRVGERERETASTAANSANNYRRLIASVSHFLSPQPTEYIRVPYFLVTIYIYIYIAQINDTEKRDGK